MAPEKAPAFQFYPSDFLMDGNVAQMTLMERGAYITLICLCWQERSLPCAPERLARLIGSTTTVFLKLWPALEPCFRISPDDPARLIHPRLEKEREKQELYRQRQANAGRASGATRRQPEVNRGSTEPPTEPQPEGNSSSSVFDLRTSVENKLPSSNEDVRCAGAPLSYTQDTDARKAMIAGMRRPYQRVPRAK